MDAKVTFPVLLFCAAVCNPLFASEQAEQGQGGADSISSNRTFVAVTNIAECLRLASQVETNKPVSVRVRGALFQPVTNMFLIVDESAAMMVFVSDGYSMPSRKGDIIEVEGRIEYPIRHGLFAGRINIIGHGAVPEPLPVSLDDVLSGRFTSRLVTVEGRVRTMGRAQSALWVTLYSGGKYLPVTLLNWVEDSFFVGSELRVIGVCLSKFDSVLSRTYQWVLVGSQENVEIIRNNENPFSRPVRKVKHSDGKPLIEDSFKDGVHVRGVVVHGIYGKGFWIRDQNYGLSVRCSMRDELIPGEEVDVYGFVKTANDTVLLEDATFRRRGKVAPPRPVLLTSREQALAHVDDLVAIEGEVVGEHFGIEGDRRIMVRGKTVSAHIITDPWSDPAGREWNTGSRVRVAGICMVKKIDDPDNPMDRSMFSVQVLMRTPRDLTILQPSPWWSARTIAIVMGVMTGFLLLVIGVGVVVMRVRSRRMAMQRLHEQAMETERARIARDMHDELGARVTQISLLSAMSEQDPALPGHLRNSVGSISRISRELVAALSEVVWTINPAHGNLNSFADYLCQMTSRFCEGTGMSCRLDVPSAAGDEPLPSHVRHNLILAVREALNNAAKHARAREVRVQLARDGHGLTVRVQDNGCGFDMASTGAGNGLGNMRQRLEGLGGSTSIQSSAGSGTVVTFRLPEGILGRKGGKA